MFNFILLHVDIEFSQQQLLEILSFPHCIFLLPGWRSVHNIHFHCFLRNPFCSMGLYACLCPSHIVLIIITYRLFYYCTNTVTVIHKNVKITQRNNQIKRNNSGTLNITTKNNSYSENNEQSTFKIQMWVLSLFR